MCHRYSQAVPTKSPSFHSTTTARPFAGPSSNTRGNPMFMRGHRVLTLAAVENDVDLAAKAQVGTLSESLNVTVFNTANKGASNAANPAMRTGLNWKPGS